MSVFIFACTMGCLNVKFCPPEVDEPRETSRGTQVYDGELLYLRSHCRLQDLEVARLDSELVESRAEICRLKGKYWRLELDEQLAAQGRLMPFLV